MFDYNLISTLRISISYLAIVPLIPFSPFPPRGLNSDLIDKHAFNVGAIIRR